MLRKTFSFVALCVVLTVAANQAAAATVALQLVYNPTAVGCAGCTLSGPGTYQLFANAAGADNNGIASYSISVQNVSSLLHRAPRVTSSTDENGDGGPAGFSLFRSANNAVALGTGFMVGASQDTVAPTPYLIDGFGQTAGSFANELPPGNTNVGTLQATWNANLLLAEGSFTGATPDLDLANIDVFMNLFSPGGTSSVFKAETLTKQICEGTCGLVVDPVVGDLNLATTTLGEVIGGNVPVTNVNTLAFNAVGAPVFTPLIPGMTLSLPNQPTLSNAGAFSWNTDGAKRGTYAWAITGTGAGGATDGGTITVNVTQVPEPGTLALFGLAIAGVVGIARRRS
jgi:hypothetical protein